MVATITKSGAEFVEPQPKSLPYQEMGYRVCGTWTWRLTVEALNLMNLNKDFEKKRRKFY